MINDIEKDDFASVKRLSSDTDFYNHVFKRIERIASVTFYILSHIDRNKKTELHHQYLSDRAMQLHNAVLQSLNLHEYEAKDGLHELMQSMVALESTLQLATAARVVRPDVEAVITTEIDAVERYLSNHYLKEEMPALLARSSAMSVATSKPVNRRPRKRASTETTLDVSSQASAVQSAQPDRATLIKTVLEARPQASIKDIASIVTDCSEKTIQRELNSLIEKREVLREGEKRWSRYSLVS